MNTPKHAPPDPSLDWESFTFSLNGVRTDKMWLDAVITSKNNNNESFSENPTKCLVEFGNLSLSPTCTVLNYGQGLFEGLKAFRRADQSIVLFRPERNARRMQEGAARLCLETVPIDTFVKAADEVVRANARFVPPFDKGALYLRPMLYGSAEDLGVKPSYETSFCIYCSPVGNYFKGGLKAIKLKVATNYTRAAPGGVGGVKAIGNYAPAFLVQRQVKQAGCDEALFLDVSKRYIEEAGASNFFAVFDNNTKLVTPSLDAATILPGVTRSSILQLATDCSLTVVEERLTLDDIRSATEAFCCGTGASITPVGRVTVNDDDDSIVYGDGETAGAITQKLYDMLKSIQLGTDPELNTKYNDWIHVVEP